MINEALNNPDKHWLIKSSTRILGPFTLLEVTELLKSKHISIIDEIRQPAGRWSYIRENKMFLEIVRNIREEQDATAENTMTQSIAQHTMTKTADAITISDELTPTPIPKDFPTPAMKDVKDVSSKGETAVPRSMAARSAARSYGASGDRRVQEELQKKSAVWRWTAIGVALVAAVVVGVMFSQKEKKNLGFDQLIHQALRYKSLGIYDRSLKYYQKATAVGEPDFDAQVQMAPVLISEDRQTLVGRRIYEKALIDDGGQHRSRTLDAYLGIAVSYMMDGDLKQAEDTLTKAVGYDPSNLSAQLNLAIIEFKKGNYAEAKKRFEEIYRKNSSSMLALLGRAMSTVEVSKQNNDFQANRSLVDDLKAAVLKTGYLRQELSMFLAYMQAELKDSDGFSQALGVFLNETPGQASLYTHPLFVDWRFSQWDYLEKYCSELYSNHPPTPHLKAFRAVCLMEINRDGDSQKLLQEGLAEAPNDAFVLVTQASYLKKANMIPEALAILKVPALQTLALRDHLMGDICIATQDVNCAQNAFTALYNKDQRDVEALYGLAWVVLRKKERSMAYDYVRAGLQAEPNYLPLLELRDKMESE